jgi:RHS repeat-associated protein
VLDRLTSLTSPAGASTFAYDALSRRTNLTLPNGTQTTYTYDPASQVSNVLHQLTASSSQINKADYLYNGVGNRTSLTDRRGSQAFGYDNLDRLTSASHPLLATPQSFAYDAVGNRTIAGNVTNAGNQLTADATHAYQYDDNGNLTRKTLLATGNYTQYSYDPENRLTKVEDFAAGNPTPAFTSTYRYDGLGRRIEKVANGQTKRYIYDGEDILLQYDGTNTLQARYTHGPRIDEPIAVTKGGSTFFYHQDGLGSVTDLTDSTGATAKSYAYDAYGNILESPGSLEQPHTYTGREFDAESGLYYYRKRTYDPLVARFFQKDPMGLGSGDPNLYTYVRNNPTKFVDPTGEFLQLAAPLIPLIPPLVSAIAATSADVASIAGAAAIIGIISISGDTTKDTDKENIESIKRRCINLYVRCKQENWKGRCDDCLRYCIAQEGVWPFNRCRPRRCDE